MQYYIYTDFQTAQDDLDAVNALYAQENPEDNKPWLLDIHGNYPLPSNRWAIQSDEWTSRIITNITPEDFPADFIPDEMMMDPGGPEQA